MSGCHALTIRRAGQVEFAYTGEKAWHGLGTEVPVGSSVETWRQSAGMEWSIDSAPVQFSAGGEIFQVDDRRVLHRSDNKMPLGVVSLGYQIVQPGDILGFFDDLVRSVGLSLETAGTLFGGKKFWALARIGEEALIDTRDKIRGYLLLTTSADGSAATTGKLTSVRVVCRNTLSAAMGDGSQSEIKISHSSTFLPDSVKQSLGVAPRSFEVFMGDMRKLADHKVSPERAVEFTDRLLGRLDTPTGKSIQELFLGKAIGFEEPGFEGTAWGWLNSVTEFVDHGRKSSSDSHRLNTILFGSGDRLKSKARDLALALVG